ncbi:hypothetical protein J0H58_32300 [bacterium]|nr:hypothetical protein [bacterium]
MTPEVIYSDPIGSAFRRVSAEELAELMAGRGEDYWNAAGEAGFAGLTFCPDGWTDDGPQTARLDFTMKSGVGFHFYYYVAANLGLPTADLLSSRGGPLGDVVEVNWAGEKRKIYRSLFVPLEAAQKVVRAFCATGEPSDAVLWLDCRTLPDPG